MPRTLQQLRDDAFALWNAALAAVRSDRLVQDAVQVEGHELLIEDEIIDLRTIRRIVVVGAGKAGAGMAAGLEAALGPRILQEKQLQGWINVPADCIRPLERIHLHPARPAGVNEPREEGVIGTERILELVSSLDPDDLCFCLISGGGSALLPAPAPGITLEEKLAATRFLSSAGANIQELNTVRTQLSRIKGGGLSRACRAGRLITLIISDVLGDPLPTIASGPTVPTSSTAEQALAVLERYNARGELPTSIFDYLENQARSVVDRRPSSAEVVNLVIGNNATAVDAAGVEAERRGYSHAMISARELEGSAEELGRHLARMALQMRDQSGPDCLISGGEPVVKLAPESIRGKGGRNQQLVLAALLEVLEADPRPQPFAGLVMLSGGTDGEDGPTDAAGAWIDVEKLQKAHALGLDAADFLRRNDAYHFFAPLEGLLKTGPTHTNVCDVRIIVVDRVQTP